MQESRESEEADLAIELVSFFCVWDNVMDWAAIGTCVSVVSGLIRWRPENRIWSHKCIFSIVPSVQRLH